MGAPCDALAMCLWSHSMSCWPTEISATVWAHVALGGLYIFLSVKKLWIDFCEYEKGIYLSTDRVMPPKS